MIKLYREKKNNSENTSLKALLHDVHIFYYGQSTAAAELETMHITLSDRSGSALTPSSKLTISSFPFITAK